MTVRRGSGDLGGDLATPPPATDRKVSAAFCSPEWLCGSRFWMMQASDDEVEEDDEEVSSAPEVTDKTIRYLCRSPSPVSGRDIVDDSTALARRLLKRIKRRDEQRLATKAAMALISQEGTCSPLYLSLDKSSGKTKDQSRPVMEPSVFLDESTEGWTVVRRRRWPSVIDRTALDPKITENSNHTVLGLARLRASPNHKMDRGSPLFTRQRLSNASRSNGDRTTRQARVGHSVAGRAFRNLLGLAWRKFATSEPVVRRRALANSMNGDGGQGGFNPGRGGFNAGRGGYQGRGGLHGRGGFQGRGGYQGRGGNAMRGRQNPGVVRGGHGYGVPRGLQGNAANAGLGGGRNFTQGESSGTVGMGSGNQQDNWGGANHFQRSSNYNNGSNFGYGGNQQRWNVARGGGFQYRARDNGAGVQARSGIDADLLHQTVQAVVAAVTAATKISEPTQNVPHVAANTTDILARGADQHAVMPVAVSNAVPQQTQGVQDTQVAGAKGKDNEGQGPLKKKKEDKTGCFHCKQPGHYIDDCPTPFCDLCESIHHAAPACHLLQAPKPSAIIHGYANEALMFFELPCGAFKAKVENPKLAKVTVDGDAMTIPELIDQLKKFVPSDKFNWVVFHFKENIYRVKLPSKQEVQRLKNFGTYICTDRESCLTFDLWSSLEEPLYTLPEV
ncbi:hypothetical protein ACQ4PT_053994 [Festuca glaucescens]